MTIIAGLDSLKMCRPLANGDQAIMAALTATLYIVMIYPQHIPGHIVVAMASVAEIRTEYMIGRFAFGDSTIMTTYTRFIIGIDMPIIRAGYPTTGVMTGKTILIRR